MTKIEARNLPPEIVKRRTLDQLADILTLPPYPGGSKHPKKMLDTLWFNTTPRATTIDGLCQTDTLEVEFVPLKAGGTKSDEPTRAAGFSAQSTYYQVWPAAEKYAEELTIQQHERLDAKCATLDPEKTHFLRADSADIASQGIALLKNVLTDIKSGQSSFSVACPNYKSQCRDLFEPDAISHIWSIHRLDSDAGSTWTIDSLSPKFEIRTKWDHTVQSIMSVTAWEMVVIADYRID